MTTLESCDPILYTRFLLLVSPQLSTSIIDTEAYVFYSLYICMYSFYHLVCPTRLGNIFSCLPVSSTLRLCPTRLDTFTYAERFTPDWECQACRACHRHGTSQIEMILIPPSRARSFPSSWLLTLTFRPLPHLRNPSLELVYRVYSLCMTCYWFLQVFMGQKLKISSHHCAFLPPSGLSAPP